MDFERLKELVVKEAIGLKANATEVELSKLDLQELNPVGYTTCIYGQITDDCHSARARELLLSCATPIAEQVGYAYWRDGRCRELPTFKFNVSFFGSRDYFSALEVYITLPDMLGGTKNLVKYLQGTKKELSINDL